MDEPARDQAEPMDIRVVLNWFIDLQRFVPRGD